MQRHNLEVTRQDSFEFTFVYDTSNIDVLSDVNIVVRPRYMDENDKKIGDAKYLTSLAIKCLFGLIVTKNERFLIVEESDNLGKNDTRSNDAVEWIMTVTDVNIDIDDWDDELRFQMSTVVKLLAKQHFICNLKLKIQKPTL